MDAASPISARLPALPVALAPLIGVIPVALLGSAILEVGATGGFDPGSWLGVAFPWIALGGLFALVLGAPLVLKLLRDPAAGWGRWLAVGLLGGVIATAALAIVIGKPGPIGASRLEIVAAIALFCCGSALGSAAAARLVLPYLLPRPA